MRRNLVSADSELVLEMQDLTRKIDKKEQHDPASSQGERYKLRQVTGVQRFFLHIKLML
jgi:hypothetical protein